MSQAPGQRSTVPLQQPSKSTGAQIKAIMSLGEQKIGVESGSNIPQQTAKVARSLKQHHSANASHYTQLFCSFNVQLPHIMRNESTHASPRMCHNMSRHCSTWLHKCRAEDTFGGWKRMVVYNDPHYQRQSSAHTVSATNQDTPLAIRRRRLLYSPEKSLFEVRPSITVMHSLDDEQPTTTPNVEI